MHLIFVNFNLNFQPLERDFRVSSPAVRVLGTVASGTGFWV